MQKIKNNAWLQGAILKETFTKKLAEEKGLQINKGDLLIAINQDCDLIHHSYKNEPHAEFVIARRIEETEFDGNFSKARNPRTLHLKINKKTYAIAAYDRVFVNRRVLESEKPSKDFVLDETTRLLLPKWVGRKYFRAAFPDNFNRRLRAKERKIRDLLKKKGHFLEEVYIRLSNYEELNDDEYYSVILLATISDDTDVAEAQGVVDKLASLMGECKGINIIDSKAQYDEEVTLANVREMDIWSDYDYLSIPDTD